jgi:ribulose-5-phosphate 4-epimerase/fuculose-1-phosphate aldolase
VRFEQISAKEKTGKMYEKLKQVIVEIAKTIDQKSLVNTYEGNLSIRHDGRTLITPSGRSKASLMPDIIAG